MNQRIKYFKFLGEDKNSRSTTNRRNKALLQQCGGSCDTVLCNWGYRKVNRFFGSFRLFLAVSKDLPFPWFVILRRVEDSSPIRHRCYDTRPSICHYFHLYRYPTLSVPVFKEESGFITFHGYFTGRSIVLNRITNGFWAYHLTPLPNSSFQSTVRPVIMPRPVCHHSLPSSSLASLSLSLAVVPHVWKNNLSRVDWSLS